MPDARLGRQGRQPCGESLHPVAGHVRLQRGPDPLVRREGVRVDAGEDGPQPEPRATGQDPDAATGPERLQRGQGVGPEVGDGVRLVCIDEVEAVVDDPQPLLGRRLGGADVEVAVDLPRVGRHDLGGDPAGEQAFRERDREPGLAGGGRAADDDERGEGHAGSGQPAAEGVRPSVVDRHPDLAPEQVRRTRDVDELVLAGPPGEVREARGQQGEGVP